jgi:hypothetical protein
LHNPETTLAVILLAVAAAAARFRWRWTGWWERSVNRLARRPALAALAVAALPALLRVALLPWLPAPEPRVHDEFSLLLAADTFASGRVVNPALPFARHFESMHIMVQPHYASAFPAAPAVFLALGSVLFGSAWAGVLLGVAFMCGATFWALGGWLPRRWALVGAGVLALRLGVSSYWTNSYWGGAVAAAGGALVLGALTRILKQPNWRYALVMALGLTILGHSRPYEGGILGLGACIVLAVYLARDGRWRQAAVLRNIAAPLGAALLVAAVWTLWYFRAVTGNPFVLPYALYRSTYAVAPHFVWQSLRPEPVYNNEVLRYFFAGVEAHFYSLAREAPLADLAAKIGAYWRFYLGPLLSVPLLAAPALWKDRAARTAILTVFGFSLFLAPEVWHNAHYAAPATALVIGIVVFGMRRIRRWRWRGLRIGLHLVRSLPGACAVMLVIQIAAGIPSLDGGPWAGWRWPPIYTERARIARQLASIPGRHLVFVRYGRNHDPGNEWVYNGADIAGSKIAWARELEPESNTQLRGYFASRRSWLVEPDEPSPRLTAYEFTETPAEQPNGASQGNANQ